MYLNIFVKKKTESLVQNVEEILPQPSESSVSGSNYGNSSRRVEMNKQKGFDNNKKNKKGGDQNSDDSVDIEVKEGCLKMVKKDKNNLFKSDN